MSNPVERLRRIIAPSKAARGVVTAVEDGLARVATPGGLVELPAPDWVYTGARVTIGADGRIIRPTPQGNVYWV